MLGPEPWRTGYVEPSIRPDDGRYGENPFRFQQFYQYQVILKPAPDDMQDIYLARSRAIGIDVARHDIRFVEDNWENPSLGAAGLGWEVWMDGMEITQFTYFQQAGGIELDPISCELAYGLERLAMYLQGVERVQDVRWSEGVSWADVYFQNERQMSTYNYELADTAMHARHFDEFEAEARPLRRGAAAAAGLRLRAQVLARVQPARFPPGDRGHRPGGLRPADAAPDAGRRGRVSRGRRTLPVPDLLSRSAARSCPAAHCRDAEAALPGLLAAELDRAGLPRGARRHPCRAQAARGHRIRPARERREAERREVRGPRADAPEQARQGFARKHGIDAAALEERDGFVWVVSEGPPAPAAELVPAAISAAVAGLQLPRTMRWPGGRFSRPIRWLVAKLDGEVLAAEVAGVTASGESRGPRPGREPVPIGSAATYLDDLRAHGVIVDAGERRAAIEAGIDAAGGCDDPMGKLDEVVYLVERPRVLIGEFSAGYLELPERIPVTAMQSHQRYFPIRSAGGALEPRFLVVTNGGDRRRRPARQRRGAGRPARRRRVRLRARPQARPGRDGRRARPGQLPRGQRVARGQGRPARAARGAALRRERPRRRRP